ncbi:MAG: 3-deoxy-D-manno-octulosonic acid transferase [Desulfovibrio sp.]|jgi:3-deoxy-D-manno-octulosonic-acid transferase|nr:3-deoxy-D-manno-octulosonic acid transferase [Desulfovibrio sp.]
MHALCRDMLFRLYGALWRVAAPLLARRSRLRGDFALRMHPEQGSFAALRDIPVAPGRARPLRLWVQAASAGEARLTRALLPALERAASGHPHFAARPLHVLVCTCTRQGLEMLDDIKNTYAPCPGRPEGLRLLSSLMPPDRPDIMREAVRLAAPDAVILLETELWPGLLRAAGDAALPVLLLNGRMSKKSASAYGLMRSFWHSLAPERIAAVSAEDARRFADLFGNPERVAVLPNIKFDLACPGEEPSLPPETQAGEPARGALCAMFSDGAASPRKAQAEGHAGGGPSRPAPPDNAATRPYSAPLPTENVPALLFASVREEEEGILLPLVRSLYDEEIHRRRAALIIAPRHMHRVAAWEEGLRAAGLPVQRVSRLTGRAAGGQTPPGEQPPDAHDARAAFRPAASRADRRADAGGADVRPVLLLDVFGKLQAAYRAVDAAFVGGSLAPLGGQNFLEAAGAGVPTLVGPHLDNFLWVGEDVFDAGLVRRVKDAGELREALLALLAEQAAKLCGPGRTVSVAEARAAAAAERRARFRAVIGPKLGGALRSARFVLEYLQTYDGAEPGKAFP